MAFLQVLSSTARHRRPHPSRTLGVRSLSRAALLPLRGAASVRGVGSSSCARAEQQQLVVDGSQCGMFSLTSLSVGIR